MNKLIIALFGAAIIKSQESMTSMSSQQTEQSLIDQANAKIKDMLKQSDLQSSLSQTQQQTTGQVTTPVDQVQAPLNMTTTDISSILPVDQTNVDLDRQRQTIQSQLQELNKVDIPEEQQLDITENILKSLGTLEQTLIQEQDQTIIPEQVQTTMPTTPEQVQTTMPMTPEQVQTTMPTIPELVQTTMPTIPEQVEPVFSLTPELAQMSQTSMGQQGQTQMPSQPEQMQPVQTQTTGQQQMMDQQIIQAQQDNLSAIEQARIQFNQKLQDDLKKIQERQIRAILRKPRTN